MIISIDEVATGLLVNAISAAGRWLGTAAGASRAGRGRAGEDLAIAQWFETYKLTERMPDLPGLSEKAARRLRTLLSGDDAQAAVKELLAVRLTDGSNQDAALAKRAFVLTVAAGDPEILGFAETLAEYYDDEISALVGRLGDTQLLAQIRNEALSGRMIAVLQAIERHTAALSGRPTLRTESSFLGRYRAHVLEQYGKIEPPDFERRRRVPIADIYVPTAIYDDDHPERERLASVGERPSITVRELADRLDRTVLLGDPGGGKTTASTVLMHHFASDTSQRIPFLVTLRNFASEDPPTRSIVGFIEHELETLYQCPAPTGLVELLLLTGRAVILFDGLDELLDTTRRADVSIRVERFCMEYPLTPVLVTSRVVGYDQARLDVSQFSRFRIGGFGDDNVAEYARKWFALDEGAHPDDADAFMAESESVPDLRSNPLLLSLMCILYRGEGSLPRNRAEVYEQCASLLVRRWDARRRISQGLRAGHLLEPVLRHLAWWLFTRADTQAAATERELVATTSEFLHGRGFESIYEAQSAAREFIEFSRGRMWVFSDVGTTATGEKIYSFTHRTFLEYFAAAQLAFDNDTPEKLARTLAPHVARGEWEVVGELALQIKNNTSRDGAKRVYEALLNERRRRSTEGRSNVLQFLARALRSVDPTPQVIRNLTQEVASFLFSGDSDSSDYYLPIVWQLASCTNSLDIVSSQLTAIIDTMVNSTSQEAQLNGLRLAVSFFSPAQNPTEGGPNYSPGSRIAHRWFRISEGNIQKYKDQITQAATHDAAMRDIALWNGLATLDEMLTVPGIISSLFRHHSMHVFGSTKSPYLPVMFQFLAYCWPGSAYANRTSSALTEMAIVGGLLARHPQPPWVIGPIAPWSRLNVANTSVGDGDRSALTEVTYLGAAAVCLITAESDTAMAYSSLEMSQANLGVFSALYYYIKRRYAPHKESELPELPVPEEFKQVFRDWAEWKVNFIGPASSPSGASNQQAR